MHKLLLILALALLLLPVYAEWDDFEDEDMDVTVEETAGQEVYFGVYPADLNSEIADGLGYPYTYGILLTNVVMDSPAWKAGLRDNDIITTLNGRVIEDAEAFDDMRDDLQVGEQVEVGFWREGTDMVADVVMQGRPTQTVTVMKKKILTDAAEGGKSGGYGGGSWIPVWFTPELEDVNELLSGLGFATLGEDGILMQGLGGKLPVGKNLFLGGMMAAYDDSYSIPDPDSIAYKRWMNYSTYFGGVTLDKRIPFTRNFIGSLGVLLGGGTHEVQILRTNGDYEWPTVFASSNYNTTISKNYLVVQPKVELMYRLLGWLAIRAEAGYAYGYSPKSGWRVTGVNEETFPVTGSPDTPFQGFTFSVGPWFGF